MMTDLLSLSPPSFCDFLAAEGIQRFFLVWDDAAERVRVSHPQLQSLADFFAADTRDFDQHEGFFVQRAPETGVLQGACVHRTCRGQAAGGVRYWSYDSVEDYLRDGLRLGLGMTLKNALAGLWWGGGKGVMAKGTGAADAETRQRRLVYEEYGAFMTSLRGCYVTAEDVGTAVPDMAAIFSRTRFTTCIPPELGGSGNPSVPTALGVVRGMEAALAHLEMGSLEGRTVAMQGLGHVGEPLISFLAERGVARVVGTDIDPARIETLRSAHPGMELELRVVARGDNSVLATKADIVAPCATGGVLNPKTIPLIQAPIVCGAANNQLEDPTRDDLLLEKAGVLYMPDFLVNRMGIVACADEQFGSVDDDPAIQRHLGDHWDNSIYRLSLSLLERSRATKRPLARVALELAAERSRELHPIWGHRGAQIVRSLAAGGWA